MYYCYILYSKDQNQTYVGYTSNLKRRILEHQSNPTRTTSRANDYKLVWFCAFCTKNKAQGFEKYLKSGSGRAFSKKRILRSLGEVD